MLLLLLHPAGGSKGSGRVKGMCSPAALLLQRLDLLLQVRNVLLSGCLLCHEALHVPLQTLLLLLGSLQHQRASSAQPRRETGLHWGVWRRRHLSCSWAACTSCLPRHSRVAAVEQIATTQTAGTVQMIMHSFAAAVRSSGSAAWGPSGITSCC